LIPTSNHNEALAGDTLYSAFLNHEWREIVLPFVIAGMAQLAAAIDDESDKQDFEVLYGAMIDDFYNEEIVDGTPVGSTMWYVGLDTSIPAKWLIAEGQAIDADDYPALAAIVRSDWIVAGNIVLPDLRERFLYGAAINGDIGNEDGEANHTLTIAEIPAHSHTQRVQQSGGAIVALGNSTARTATIANTTPSTGDTGGGASHNNMPPYMRGYWIIKVLP